MDFILSLLPLNSDSVETINNKYIQYSNMTCENSVKPAFIPSTNIQKDVNWGLNGFCVEMDGDDKLQAMDSVTENLFGGVSVVRCILSEEEATHIKRNKYEIDHTLKEFAELYSFSTDRDIPSLEELLPNVERNDFYWGNQVTQFSAQMQVRESIINNHKAGKLEFYNAYTCVREDIVIGDYSMKDTTRWEPILHGSIGLYMNKREDRESFVFICSSSVPLIASEINQAIKSDLVNAVSAEKFTDSKEVWFLEQFSKRNRLRLILMASKALGITVSEQLDIYRSVDDKNPFQAVELYGVCTESLHTHSFFASRENTEKHVVRHFKGCIDICNHKGPLPIEMGMSEGYIVFIPADYLDMQYHWLTNNSRFVRSLVFDNRSIFPVCNITKNSINSLNALKMEQNTLQKLSANEILEGMKYTENPLPLHTQTLIQDTDEFGFDIFYGIYYKYPLPCVICPKLTPLFVYDNKTCFSTTLVNDNICNDATIFNLTQESNNSGSELESINSVFNIPTRPSLFSFDPSTIQLNTEDKLVLKWDEYIIRNLENMHSLSSGVLQIRYLIPISNTTTI